jgi:hypothetical protein
VLSSSRVLEDVDNLLVVNTLDCAFVGLKAKTFLHI